LSFKPANQGVTTLFGSRFHYISKTFVLFQFISAAIIVKQFETVN
jgi:hypothetical protein